MRVYSLIPQDDTGVLAVIYDVALHNLIKLNLLLLHVSINTEDQIYEDDREDDHAYVDVARMAISYNV